MILYDISQLLSKWAPCVQPALRCGMLLSPRSLACCFFLQPPQYTLLSSTSFKVFSSCGQQPPEWNVEIDEKFRGDVCLSSTYNSFISIKLCFYVWNELSSAEASENAIWISLVLVGTTLVTFSSRSWGLQLPMRRSGLGRPDR